ncbi:hypothetical protein [Massilia sp. ST3]|uniref:hypothetical protein n=1 Tax=Massilia sp. ST3 TaxID=2824903 RepID=UPI001B8119B2|nr:hypothetical protein [Massilia sp. ST3]MBQ5945899.1 hypothetical protein [Massilia sp. ST3]
MAGIRAFIESLVDERAPGVPAEAIAEVLDRLLWCVADGGEEILTLRDRWLASGDEYRIAVALSMNDVFPFNTKPQLEEGLAGIASRFPSLRGKCIEWLGHSSELP